VWRKEQIDMVIQLVRVAIKPDQRDRWLELVRANAAQTRSEDGCESYDVCEDIETPNAFLLIERWRNLDAKYDNFRNPKVREADGLAGRRPRRTARGLANRGCLDVDPG
jgi:quinol monooxygenase YgiN